MKYFLIAGEASGDWHAAHLMEALKQRDPGARFAFAGGDKMQAAGGTAPVVHYREMAFMGLWDVLTHLPAIRRNFRLVKEHISRFAPDTVILVDYPGFNLRMAKWAKQQGYKVVYYISPKLWAWKEGRVEIIRRYVDKMLLILPFEVEFYRRHGIDAVYVGNPVVEETAAHRPPAREEFLRRNGLDDKPLVALLPGSRRQEIKYMLPVMMQLPPAFPQFRFVVAGAPSLEPEIYTRYGLRAGVPLIQNQTYDLLAHAHLAVVTSGTATLETALFGVPQVVGYRTQPWQYHLGKHLVKVPYFSLVNLILGREAVPELLQDRFDARRIDRLLQALDRGDARDRMLADYARLREILQDRKASETAAGEIIRLLRTPAGEHR